MFDIFNQGGKSIFPNIPLNLGKQSATPSTDMDVIKMMREIERKKELEQRAVAIAIAKKAEADKKLIRSKLSEDALFSITYVPFAIAEVVWDYVDTIFNMVQILRLHETKKLCRAIREIHTEYDRKRFKIITSEMRKSELENMELFQEELKDFFNTAHSHYNEAIRNTYGVVDFDTVWLLSAVYGCDMVLKALFRYTKAQEKVVSAILGYEIASILPKELTSLSMLVNEFAGDMPMPDCVKQEHKDNIEELAGHIAEIGLNKVN